MPQTFTSFQISGDLHDTNSITIGVAEQVSVVDDDLTADSGTIDTGPQFSIGGTDFFSTAYPGSVDGIEIYQATVPGVGVVRFAYLTASGDGVDDGVDRIIILSGSVSPGDTLTGIKRVPGLSKQPFEYSDIPGIICFTPGTLITTPRGPVLVEDLLVDDLVITADNGLQAIRWVGTKRITGARLMAFPKLRPIRIRKDAFGHGVPNRDMHVSPQHRMLIDSNRTFINYGESEVLAPAKGLVNDYSITVDYSVKSTDYIHILFDRHEIVFANGAATESFHPGHMAMSALDEAPRNELFEIFPELENGTDQYGPAARKVLQVMETMALGEDGFSLFAD
ncbi:MAG: Hint domain-containing protein [Proteobacteria bacterium]|nr:Hint domain-containing protein [Pseudomonadota bacterium]